MRVLFLALFNLALGGIDPEYDNWAAKVVDYGDEEAIRMGKEMGCMWCNLIINGVTMQHKANLKREKWNRFTEEETTEALFGMCKKMSPALASKVQGQIGDMMMVCRRVVNEHAGDMIDAVTTGEDIDDICVDAGLCGQGHKEMMGNVADLLESEQKLKAQRAAAGAKVVSPEASTAKAVSPEL